MNLIKICGPAMQHSGLSSWIPILIILGVMAAYLGAVVWQYHLARRWSGWRTVIFLLGIGLLTFALWPSLTVWGPHHLHGHMIQHLLIGMFAPIGLVLSAPVTLALRTLPVRMARRITSLLRSQLFGGLSHPVTALILNIGGMYLLYLTPLFAYMLYHPYIHTLVYIHFLAAGYLFTWAIVGPDYVPNRPGIRTRLMVLFVSMASHAYLSKVMYAYLWPRETFYSLEQIRTAAQWMYYGGDLAEVLLAVVLFTHWYQKRIQVGQCARQVSLNCIKESAG